MNNDLLLAIDQYNWLGDAVALTLLFVVLVKELKLSSTLITLAVVVLVDGLMLHYIEMLKEIKGEAQLIRFGWYIGFALMDCWVIFCVYKLHYISKTPYSAVTKLIYLEYLVYGVMQVVMYLEISIFNSHYLKGLYQNGILAINLVTTVVVMVFALMVYYHSVQRSRGREGPTWCY